MSEKIRVVKRRLVITVTIDLVEDADGDLVAASVEEGIDQLLDNTFIEEFGDIEEFRVTAELREVPSELS